MNTLTAITAPPGCDPAGCIPPPSLPGGWEGAVVGMMMWALAIATLCLGVVMARYALGGRDHTKSESRRYHAQRRNTLGIEVRGVARKLVAEGGGQRFVRFRGAEELYGRKLRALTKDLRHERAFARYVVVAEVVYAKKHYAKGLGVMVRVVPVVRAASPWQPDRPTQELRFRFGGFDFPLPFSAPRRPTRGRQVEDATMRLFEAQTKAVAASPFVPLPEVPKNLEPLLAADTLASNVHADLIRGAALRLIAAGGGVEVVPTEPGSFAGDALDTVLDPALAAADRASMTVRASKVDGGVQVEVHRELSQPEGIVHASPLDPNAWETPNYPNGSAR